MRFTFSTVCTLLAAAGATTAFASIAFPQELVPPRQFTAAGPAHVSLRGGEYQVQPVSAYQAANSPDAGIASPSDRIEPVPAAPADPLWNLQPPSSTPASGSAATSRQLDTASMIGPMRDAVHTFSGLELEDDWRYYVNIVPQGPRPIADGTAWPLYVYTWQSPAFYYRPLYFEQPNLERYGQGTYRVLQPAVSAAHFFATAPLLPVKAMIDHPLEPTYSLGHYRPGNLAPVQRNVLFGN